MSRERWMALFFALGSAASSIGPFPGYAQARRRRRRRDHVLRRLDPVHRRRGAADPDRVARAPLARRRAGGVVDGDHPVRRHAVLQRHDLPGDAHDPLRPEYNRLVWRPDALGSVCFLVSGAIAYRASPRDGWLPARGGQGWWEPAVNLLGCIFFGISAVAGYLVPSTGSMLDLAAANWNTALGAACFLACALATLLTGRTFKSPRFRRLHRLEHAIELDVKQIVLRIRAVESTLSASGAGS